MQNTIKKNHATYYSFNIFLTIIVTMQAQKEAPLDMQCKDKFLVLSVIAASGATMKDITSEMVHRHLWGSLLYAIFFIISLLIGFVKFVV